MIENMTILGEMLMLRGGLNNPRGFRIVLVSGFRHSGRLYATG
jgi:hypothetical protein